MARNEILTKARTEIEVEGKSADQVLTDLQAKADKYTRAMVEAQKANDKIGFDKAKKSANDYNGALKAVQKGTADVNAVMKNLSGATMNDLVRVQRRLTDELKRTTRGTEEYAQKSKQLRQVTGEISAVRREMSGVSGASQGMFGSLRAGFAWMLGAVGSAMVLWRGLTSTLKTTQTGADSLERTMQGLKGATTGLQQTIATGDWSNLFTNMKNGYLAAAAYADALDELADRMRAVDVRSNDQKAEMEELSNVMASVETESIEAREKAQNRYMELNKEILDATKKNSDLLIKAEREKLMRQHSLSEGEVDLLVDLVRQYDKLTEAELLNVQKLLDAQKRLKEEEGRIARARTSSRGDRMREMSQQEKESLASLSQEVSATKGLLNEKELAYYQLNDVIDKFSDAQRDNVAKALKSVADANAQFESLQRNAVRRMQALEREKKQRAVESQKAELEALEQQHQIQLLEIDRAYTEEHRNANLYRQQTEAAEWAHLEARIAMYRQFGMDTTALERERQKRIMAAMQEFQQSQFAISDQIIAKNQADTDAFLLAKIAAWEKEDAMEETRRRLFEQREGEKIEAYTRRMEQYKQITDQMATSVGSLMGQLASDTEMTSKEVARQVLLIALDTVHAIARMAIAEIWAKSLKTEDSVLTFGATGVARAVIISALVEGAFSGLKAMVMKAGQRYAGKYDVMGESDGRTYRNVPFDGHMKTGIYGRPTLVAERGNELIVDAGTLRNVSLNFPDVLPKIRASMVPQRAAGNVSEATSKGVNTYIDGDMRAAVELFLDSVRLFHRDIKNGIPAKLSYKELIREQGKNAEITSIATKK